MCTEYRLSVTPENIVVHDMNNRGHFLQQYALVSTTTLQAELLNNKESMERRSKKGIALMNIASNVHFTAISAMP
jgi:hypothetical protein